MTVIPQYTIQREPSTPDGTLGEWMDEKGNHICYTVELPWADNETDKSCIPCGNYKVIPHNSPAHPNVWEITNVPGRSGILIHAGNSEKDVLGCIAVGDSQGEIKGLPAVFNSVSTLNKLRGELPSDFILTIIQ